MRTKSADLHQAQAFLASQIVDRNLCRLFELNIGLQKAMVQIRRVDLVFIIQAFIVIMRFT